MQTSPNDKSPAQRTYHFSPRPKSVMVRANPAEGDVPLESPSPFKLPRPRQTDMASPEGGPVSPRFTLTDSRRPVPRLNLFNDTLPMPQLPPVPAPSPGDATHIDVEILVFERYQVVDLQSVDSSPSSTPPQTPSTPRWPSSPGSQDGTLSPRGQFLGTRPRDNPQ